MKPQSKAICPQPGHSIARISALIAIVAFFLPWLKIGCVNIDGSVSEDIISGYKVACGTKLLGDDFKDRKYWIFLITPAAILFLTLWRLRLAKLHKIYAVAGVITLAALGWGGYGAVYDFFFTEAKPYSESALHHFQFYFGNWTVMVLYLLLVIAVLVLMCSSKKQRLVGKVYLIWLVISLVALGNIGYLYSEFLLDDEPPPARVTYEICYGYWMILAAYAAIVAGSIFFVGIDKKARSLIEVQNWKK